MEKQANISRAVIKRLPRYYRYLADMQRHGISRTSSKELSERMGLTASQIRQDLNCFGGFGQQGYGYNVETLLVKLKEIMGISVKRTAVLIGVGNLGRAIIKNFDFGTNGISVTCAFDSNIDVIGTNIDDVQVLNITLLSDYLKENNPDIAILTLPKPQAQAVANILLEGGIRGIWNFTNLDLKLGEHNVPVESVRFADSLMTLCYFMQE